MLTTALFFIAAARIALSVRPNTTSICDYYTPIVTGQDNSPESQYALMQKITHTFILGNYTTPNVGIKVMGIAGPATFQGHQVNLLPYFTGGYASTNTGGSSGVAVNWLDDGGAGALLANKPANGTTSNQYKLLNHVYQYFGDFYGCSQQGSDTFPHYEGVASMYEVHKFMDADIFEAGFFNDQIAVAAQSIGFEDPDVAYTRAALAKTFTNRCTPPAAVIPPAAGPQLQSICVAPDCPLDPQANCSAYPDNGFIAQPAIVNATLVGPVQKQNETAPSATTSEGSSTASSSSSATGAAAPTISPSTGGAAHIFGAWTTLKTVGCASVVGAAISALAL